MFEFNDFSLGYGLSLLALLVVAAYFVIATLIVRRPGPAHASVPSYQPPTGVSPAVAAWLLARDLSRSVAAALVNMAAKGYLKIDHSQDLCTVTQTQATPSTPLEPEEDALAYRLFGKFDSFDFVEVTPQLIDAVKAFQWTLQDTTYFSSNVYLSVPAWIVSALGVLLALANTHFLYKLDRNSARLLTAAAIITFTSFLLAVRTLRGTLEKLATRLPGSTEPQRPFTGADSRPLTYLGVSIAGVCFFGILSSTTAAMVILGFLVVNGIFYHSLQGLTSAGRRVLGELSDYRLFLSQVDAPVISRLHIAERVPVQLGAHDASIADVIELAAITKKT
jgi:uncharacterized protein (TIGR04222 family)